MQRLVHAGSVKERSKLTEEEGARSIVAFSLRHIKSVKFVDHFRFNHAYAVGKVVLSTTLSISVETGTCPVKLTSLMTIECIILAPPHLSSSC